MPTFTRHEKIRKTHKKYTDKIGHEVSGKNMNRRGKTLKMQKGTCVDNFKYLKMCYICTNKLLLVYSPHKLAAANNGRKRHEIFLGALKYIQIILNRKHMHLILKNERTFDEYCFS